MKLPDILSAFHKMPTCDRLDLICRLLRGCVPYELRFLGTVILDATRVQMKSFAATEVVANQVNHYSGFKDNGLTHAVCEKLCCALAVVHADNHPVAETVFGLLDNSQALQLFEDTVDVKVLDDLRLLYVMAVNHPALTFNQRQHLLYMYLQRMDALYTEKCLTRNLTSSVEKSGEGEAGSGTLRREPTKDASITYCDVHSVYKRQPDKRYAYMTQVDWSDGTSSCVHRTYGDFFSFHTKLLDLFPEEGGQKHKKERMIPFLPGKSYPRILTNRNNRDLAEKRLPELHRYAKELLSLPEKISQCDHVLDFFRPRPEDLKEEYSSVQKITTLYDLLESGKARLRNYTDPLGKGSPTHSPQLLRSSPLHRATDTGTSQSRTSHTLPHQSTSSTSQAKEESGLERRFTYPSRRSAFTPVTPPQQHQAPPTSTHLTNSHPLIANGGSPSAATEAATMETTTMTTHSTVTAITPSLPISTSSPVTSHTPSHTSQPTNSTHLTTTASAISIISSSHPPIPTSTTFSTSQYHSSEVVKPTPTCAHPHQHNVTTVTSPTKPLSHITHPHIHRPTITSSPPPLCSGKTTPIGEVSYTIPPQLVPIGPPMQFSPIVIGGIGYGSPIPSPSPSPLTPGYRGKSSSNLARTPTEFESLSRWLKSLRLHKYASIFENMTFNELLSMDKDACKKKGMTEGAAKKFVLKTEELKAQNFSGFRDMPHMSRKPSTCSLPAALLAERGATPCSSVDGLSPTDSTCSLDKAASLVSQAGKPDLYYPTNGSASQETPSVASYDVAIVKAVTAPSTSSHTDTLKNSMISPPHSITSPSPPPHPHLHLHTLSPPTTGDIQLDSSVVGSDVSTLTRANAGGMSGGMSSSWADRLDAADEEGEANMPEWAQLHPERAKGRSHTPSHAPKPPFIKQHSAELLDGRGHTTDDSATPSRSHHHPPPTTPRNPGPAPTNWVHRPPPLLQNSHPGGRSAGRHHIPHHPPTPVSVNGLVHPSFSPPVTLPSVLQRPGYVPGAVVPRYPPVFPNHARGIHQPPPPACFNCGKKGHHGTSCPAETMDTNNPDMFHKQLERLASTQASPNSHRQA